MVVIMYLEIFMKRCIVIIRVIQMLSENIFLLQIESNLKVNVNYIKKFIKEEVAYTLGNDITYESRTDDTNIVKDIEYYTAHWDELHDTDLMKYLLIFTEVYELYYIDKKADFCSKIIKPSDGYAYKDSSSGKVLFFIHTFKNDFEQHNNIDVYTENYIYHFNDKFEEIASPSKNLFKEVPVSIGILSYEKKVIVYIRILRVFKMLLRQI